MSNKAVKEALREFGAFLGYIGEQVAQGMAAVGGITDASERTAEAMAETRGEVAELKELIHTLTGKVVALYEQQSEVNARLNLYLQDATKAEHTSRRLESEVRKVDDRLKLVEKHCG